jgi:amidophosphoribosyltransferase
MSAEIEQQMADRLGADSLKYLPVESIARCVGFPRESLCQACIDCSYPTDAGKKLYQIAIDKLDSEDDSDAKRTYDAPLTATRT